MIINSEDIRVEKTNLIVCLREARAVDRIVGKDDSNFGPVYSSGATAKKARSHVPPRRFSRLSTSQPCDPALQYSEVPAPHSEAELAGPC